MFSSPTIEFYRIPQLQYRFPKELAEFPSKEFYDGQLETGIQDSKNVLSALTPSDFPWPEKDGIIVPAVFIQCSKEEDLGGRSKSNEGQAKLVASIIPMLRRQDNGQVDSAEALKITVLTPYNKQVKELRPLLPSSVHCSTVDSFQGRESDIIIFSTVRCNVTGDIGFLEDRRRLNVMWTRARLGLVIVGDRRTMTESSGLWKRAIDSCLEVKVELPEV
jgi:superfamily I DNA and/or RNA helicase